MKKYFDFITNKQGDAIAGAMVEVFNSDGSYATIYSDNGVTVQPNPMTTDAFGYFAFYVADGRYNITTSGVKITTKTITDVLIVDPLGSLGLSTGASLIGFKQSGTGAVSRTVQSKNEEIVSVKDFGAVGDGVLDDTTAIQANATRCDADNLPYMYIPTNTENYLISAPIVFVQPGVKIFGHKGASYNRGTGKNGNILIGSGAAHALDLGNSRTTGNPADNWTVSNIGFLQATGVATGTKDGILFTARTDGPDRGGVVREVSATGLNKVINVPTRPQSTALANLIIENCCFSNNKYALYSDANVLGLRFVGNQAEQNGLGCIYGMFTSGIVIEDNMLEGQVNPVTILPPPVGNIPQVSIKRNYLESNTGTHMFALTTTTRGVLELGPNYNFSATRPTDYCVLTGAWTVENKDIYPITLNTDVATLITFGSKPFNKYTNVFNISGAAMPVGNFSMHIETHPEFALPGTGVGVVTSSAVSATLPHVQTPLGMLPVTPTNTMIVANIAAAVNDILVIHCLVRFNSEGSFINQLWNQSTTLILAEESPIVIDSGSVGKWMVRTIICIAANAATGVRLRYYNAVPSSVSIDFAGYCIENKGSYTALPVKRLDGIAPLMPNITMGLTTKLAYTPPSLVSGASTTTDVPLVGAANGSLAIAGFSQALGDVGITAWVTATDVVRVRLTNYSASTVALGAGTLKVEIVAYR